MQNLSCPKCERELQLPDEYSGQLVQCPHCQHTFNPPATSFSEAPLPVSRTAPAPLVRDDTWDDEDERAPRSSTRRRRGRDDDYDDVGFPGDRSPHRGAAVLTLGILSLVLCGPILGPIAWSMGTNDLRAMAEGRMERSGEGITRAGQIIGMVATILSICAICLWLVIFMAAAGMR